MCGGWHVMYMWIRDIEFACTIIRLDFWTIFFFIILLDTGQYGDLYMLSLGLGVMCVLMKQSLACYLVENEICDIRLQYMYIKLMFVAMVTVCKTRLVVWIYIFVPKTFRWTKLKGILEEFYIFATLYIYKM